MRSRDVSLASKADVPVLRSLPQGKCLTQPSEPVSNKGLDNSEGNLIVHENDAISVSRSQIHVLSKEKMNVKRADFRIQGLLGQGTFAHVFQCLHVQTGNLVAIKIVKNKQAYTRQAAVEIDVFRALTKGNVDQEASVSSRPDTASVASRNGEEKSQHMVDLICYFMHQNHLCLVFELLGLNLYDVLKKRQFRGLPLSVVRILAKQAVLGIKELAKKNVVHCDLKPENILLISDDDVDSVVSAGENRRSSSRSLSSLDKKPNGNHDRTSNDPPTSTTTNDKAQGSLTNTPSSGPISQSPSNSLGTNGSTITAGHSLAAKTIKLIDFGSACFEGQSTHTYIQSRFYRSPEVLLGLPYDSAIDMWSLGCVAAELFLGLPILPGVHEHDQLSRICEMISCPSDWMLEQGSSASKFFIKQVVASHDDLLPMERPSSRVGSKVGPKWRVRTQQEYIQTLSQSEIKKKGGLAKLEKQPANRYFKRKHLADIVAHKGQSGSPEDRDSLDLFVHFLYGKGSWLDIRWIAWRLSHVSL
jgi:serine/threonine protein kinase